MAAKRKREEIEVAAETRVHPQLSLKEEAHFRASLPVEAIRRELAEAKEELAKERANAVVDPKDREHAEIFGKYHTDAEVLMRTPDAPHDPQPERPSWATAAWSVYTNACYVDDMFRRWIMDEADKTVEGKKYRKWQNKIYALGRRVRRLAYEIEWLEWASEATSKGPIALSKAGARFVAKCVKHVPQPPPPPHKKKADADKKRPPITSLFLPVDRTENGKTVVEKYRVRRDNACAFTADGSALVFFSGSDPCGVIYATSPTTFWSLEPYAEDEHSSRGALLAAAVSEIFAAIGKDAEAYFSEVGKRCGTCMFCGRDLSDEESKARGYGAACEKRVFGKDR